MFQKIFSFLSFIAFSLMSFLPIAVNADDKPPVDVQELFTSTKPIYGESFSYPEGKGEMRLYKVDVQPGGVVPLHFHEAPLTSYIEQGELTLKTKRGKSTTFRQGDSFVLAADTPPHTMSNNGKVQAVMWVTVAAAEGVPTLTNVE
ncbi:cupin domain-containing protein [Prochlorococcus marinus XMU1408]|uniref:Cupin domain-containing protein n=2 Tax=Prochlorococcus marinus TaxID=1219 RepID=A0A318RIR4_PROMR|nr:cupin domain-containing protein [Prochlorococcus marinus str. XMU1408]PYE03712.1 cupin domain-containing protein [Prochlorococcus marinus XMU1408]